MKKIFGKVFFVVFLLLSLLSANVLGFGAASIYQMVLQDKPVSLQSDGLWMAGIFLFSIAMAYLALRKHKKNIIAIFSLCVIGFVLGWTYLVYKVSGVNNSYAFIILVIVLIAAISQFVLRDKLSDTKNGFIAAALLVMLSVNTFTINQAIEYEDKRAKTLKASLAALNELQEKKLEEQQPVTDDAIPRQAPEIISTTETDVSKVAALMIKKIKQLIEPTEDQFTAASVELIDEDRIVLNYVHKYDWRETDRHNEILVYTKKSADWQLAASIPGRISGYIPDLNKDGIKEIIVHQDTGSFRTYYERSHTVMISDEKTASYNSTNLVASSSGVIGECEERNNQSEEISVGRFEPQPVIEIKTKTSKVNASTCEDVIVSTLKAYYVWSEALKKFVLDESIIPDAGS